MTAQLNGPTVPNGSKWQVHGRFEGKTSTNPYKIAMLSMFFFAIWVTHLLAFITMVAPKIQWFILPCPALHDQ